MAADHGAAASPDHTGPAGQEGQPDAGGILRGLDQAEEIEEVTPTESSDTTPGQCTPSQDSDDLALATPEEAPGQHRQPEDSSSAVPEPQPEQHPPQPGEDSSTTPEQPIPPDNEKGVSERAVKKPTRHVLKAN